MKTIFYLIKQAIRKIKAKRKYKKWDRRVDEVEIFR